MVPIVRVPRFSVIPGPVIEPPCQLNWLVTVNFPDPPSVPIVSVKLFNEALPAKVNVPPLSRVRPEPETVSVVPAAEVNVPPVRSRTVPDAVVTVGPVPLKMPPPPRASVPP